MVFKLMSGTFGDDGLISKHKVFHADTPEACWQHMYDTVRDASGPYAKLTRLEMLTCWVEEHTNLDDDYSAVRTDNPYPGSIKQFDPPDYIKVLMGQPQSYFEGADSLRQREAETGPVFERPSFEETMDLLSDLRKTGLF